MFSRSLRTSFKLPGSGGLLLYGLRKPQSEPVERFGVIEFFHSQRKVGVVMFGELVNNVELLCSNPPPPCRNTFRKT